MYSSPPVVHVFVATDCPEDVEFANRLRETLSSLSATVQVQSLDQLALAASGGALSHLYALKIPVFVLSAASVASTERRAFLARGDPLLGRPTSVRRYYVCRDSQPRQLLAAFPELQRLAHETMLVHKDSVNQIMADLREYLTTDEVTGRRLALRVFRMVATPLLLPIGILSSILDVLGRLLFICGFAAGPVLIVLMLIDFSASWRVWCALLSLFTAGVAVHNIDTLDVWPWLGPRWRALAIDADVPGECKSRHVGNTSSLCSDAEFKRSASEWRTARDWLVILRLLALGPTVGPATVQLLVTGGMHIGLFVAALGCGLAFPVLMAIRHRLDEKHEAAYRGLTEGHLLRTEHRIQRYSVKPLPELSGVDGELLRCFTPEEVTTISRWVSLAALSGVCAFDRPWLRRRDRVFISYVWADDPQLGVALDISRILDAAGVRHYIDKRPIRSGFVGWRTNVAVELARATHVVLVVSPAILNGVIVAREMRTILHRWFTDALPAVVCVGEPHVAERLRADPAVPLHLRFFLTWCPQLTLDEARNPHALLGVLRQRRRQGRVRDWWTLMVPEPAERRAAAELVRV